MSAKHAVAEKDMVSSIELAGIKRERARLARIRKELEAAGEALAEREADVIARIEEGVPVDGKAVVVTRRRQNISWLAVVREELGDKAVIAVKDRWPVTFSKELQLS
jgi:hypothetical protein